jgi:hypothetical protein
LFDDGKWWRLQAIGSTKQKHIHDAGGLGREIPFLAKVHLREASTSKFNISAMRVGWGGKFLFWRKSISMRCVRAIKKHNLYIARRVETAPDTQGETDSFLLIALRHDSSKI